MGRRRSQRSPLRRQIRNAPTSRTRPWKEAPVRSNKLNIDMGHFGRLDMVGGRRFGLGLATSTVVGRKLVVQKVKAKLKFLLVSETNVSAKLYPEIRYNQLQNGITSIAISP